MIQLIVIALGAVFAVIGIILFAKGVGKDSPTTVKFPGTEFNFSGSALLVFIVGCALIYIATKVPENALTPNSNSPVNSTSANMPPMNNANTPATSTPAAVKDEEEIMPADSTPRRPLPPANGQPLGIDVSQHQTVDWQHLDKKYVSFVMIKATEGTKRNDAEFDRNWAGAEQAGVKRGAYHVFHADEDGAAQAQWFLTHVQLGANDLPPILDVESLPVNAQVSNEVLTRRITDWLNYVAAQTQRVPIIYTNKAFWDGHVSGDFGRYSLWVARYGDRVPANLPHGWHSWAFWHYTDETQVGGIAGAVDSHMFNGSYQDLQSFK